MESSISSVCYVGIYGSNQNGVLRDGLAEHDVTVYNAGISTQRETIGIGSLQIPLYSMKPTLNWFSRYPSSLVPVLFAVALLFHAVLTYSLLIANVGDLRRSDLLVVPHFGDTAVLLVKPVAVLLDTPIVYISHNGLYCTLVENREVFAPTSVTGQMIRFLDSAIQRSADRVIVFSDYSQSVLSTWFNVPEERYATVYIGVEESKFAGERLPQLAHSVNVLYWGNFIPHHGVETMVQAAANVPEYEFVFAGKSDQREEIIELSDSLDAENVSFPGFLSDGELEANIRGADIVLGPLSAYTQSRMNIGTKVAEAASLRKAIVLGDNPAPNEVFDHGESAFLVEPEDPVDLATGLETILSDDALRTRLESGSYSVYERYFTPSKVAAQFLAAAEQTVASQ